MTQVVKAHLMELCDSVVVAKPFEKPPSPLPPPFPSPPSSTVNYAEKDPNPMVPPPPPPRRSTRQPSVSQCSQPPPPLPPVFTSSRTKSSLPTKKRKRIEDDDDDHHFDGCDKGLLARLLHIKKQEAYSLATQDDKDLLQGMLELQPVDVSDEAEVLRQWQNPYRPAVLISNVTLPSPRLTRKVFSTHVNFM
jgi:hypothetical protein